MIPGTLAPPGLLVQQGQQDPLGLPVPLALMVLMVWMVQTAQPGLLVRQGQPGLLVPLARQGQQGQQGRPARKARKAIPARRVLMAQMARTGPPEWTVQTGPRA